MSRRRYAAAALAVLCALTLGLSANAAPRGSSSPRATRATPVEVVAVGDVACPTGWRATRRACRQRATARLTRTIDPAAVLMLGDEQYNKGSLYGFRHSYDASWGSLLPITHPVPGNHEYETAGATGYYTYFEKQQPGPPGYYTEQIGAWRVYALNSNCRDIDCEAQYTWLNQSLTENPSKCTAFTMHHPRFSSGEHGSDVRMRRFVRIAYRHHVDLVLAGHDHHYERFRRMNPAGRRAADGFIEFVSGAGGRELRGPGRHRAPGSVARTMNRFGVLRLVLRQDDFKFAFKPLGGGTLDRGRAGCV